MKPDTPIIGGEPKSNALFSIGMLTREWKRVYENANALETMRKIHELRKSCGVESQETIKIKVSTKR
jgi:hypothetical protein